MDFGEIFKRTHADQGRAEREALDQSLGKSSVAPGTPINGLCSNGTELASPDNKFEYLREICSVPTTIHHEVLPQDAYEPAPSATAVHGLKKAIGWFRNI